MAVDAKALLRALLDLAATIVMIGVALGVVEHVTEKATAKRADPLAEQARYASISRPGLARPHADEKLRTPDCVVRSSSRKASWPSAVHAQLRTPDCVVRNWADCASQTSHMVERSSRCGSRR